MNSRGAHRRPLADDFESTHPAHSAHTAYPASIATQINGERVVVLGWGRAILLQLAHPLIAAGVYEHSGFRTTPLAAVSRLHHTIRAMLALTFGDDTARTRALEGIRTIHRRVHGHLTYGTSRFPAGTAYSAEDPDLVCWVHLTLIESVVMAYDHVVRPLSVAERDAYCEASRPVALELGARDVDVPHEWSALRAAIDRAYRSGEIEVTPPAHELARALLWPAIGAALPPLAWAQRTLTASLLPEQLRIAYELPWSPWRARGAAATMRALRIARRVAPSIVTRWSEARRVDRTPLPIAPRVPSPGSSRAR